MVSIINRLLQEAIQIDEGSSERKDKLGEIKTNLDKITTLELPDKLDSKCYDILLDLMKDNKTILQISEPYLHEDGDKIRNGIITDHGAKALLEILEVNEYIIDIDLKNNEIDPKILSEINFYLARNKVFRFLREEFRKFDLDFDKYLEHRKSVNVQKEEVVARIIGKGSKKKLQQNFEEELDILKSYLQEKSLADLTKQEQLITSLIKIKNDNRGSEWKLEIHQLDVGQGDSALILFKKWSKQSKKYEVDKSILIDAGRKYQAYHITRYVQSKIGYQAKLDAVIITHLDEDHYGGLLGEKRKSGSILDSLCDKEKTVIFNLSNKKDTPKKSPKESLEKKLEDYKKYQTITFGETIWALLGGKPEGAPDLRIIAAGGTGIGGFYTDSSDANKSSTVSLIEIGGFRFYTAGDFEASSSLIGKMEKAGLLPVQAFLTPHHGGQESININFANTIQARSAIISHGSQSHSTGDPHPDKNVVASLEKSNIDYVYMTNPALPLRKDAGTPQTPEKGQERKLDPKFIVAGRKFNQKGELVITSSTQKSSAKKEGIQRTPHKNPDGTIKLKTYQSIAQRGEEKFMVEYETPGLETRDYFKDKKFEALKNEILSLVGEFDKKLGTSYYQSLIDEKRISIPIPRESLKNFLNSKQEPKLKHLNPKTLKQFVDSFDPNCEDRDYQLSISTFNDGGKDCIELAIKNNQPSKVPEFSLESPSAFPSMNSQGNENNFLLQKKYYRELTKGNNTEQRVIARRTKMSKSNPNNRTPNTDSEKKKITLEKERYELETPTKQSRNYSGGNLTESFYDDISENVSRKLFEEEAFKEIDSLSEKTKGLSLDNKNLYQIDEIKSALNKLGFQDNEIITKVDIENFPDSEISTKETLELALDQCIGLENNQRKVMIFKVKADEANFPKKDEDLNQSNHYVGLHITKKENGEFIVYYIDPTGREINKEITKIINERLQNTQITSSSHLLQQVEEIGQGTEKIIAVKGTNCGPFLAYLLKKYDNQLQNSQEDGEQQIIRLNEAESDQLGSKLREHFEDPKTQAVEIKELDEIANRVSKGKTKIQEERTPEARPKKANSPVIQRTDHSSSSSKQEDEISPQDIKIDENSLYGLKGQINPTLEQKESAKKDIREKFDFDHNGNSYLCTNLDDENGFNIQLYNGKEKGLLSSLLDINPEEKQKLRQTLLQHPEIKPEEKQHFTGQGQRLGGNSPIKKQDETSSSSQTPNPQTQPLSTQQLSKPKILDQYIHHRLETITKEEKLTSEEIDSRVEEMMLNIAQDNQTEIEKLKNFLISKNAEGWKQNKRNIEQYCQQLESQTPSSKTKSSSSSQLTSQSTEQNSDLSSEDRKFGNMGR